MPSPKNLARKRLTNSLRTEPCKDFRAPGDHHTPLLKNIWTINTENVVLWKFGFCLYVLENQTMPVISHPDEFDAISHLFFG